MTMTTMELIKDIFGLLPKGPKYGLEDLVFHNEQYGKHVRMARENLERLLLNKRHNLTAKDADHSVNPIEALAKIQFSWAPRITGWVDDEFIPKIRKFSERNYTPSTLPSGRVDNDIRDIPSQPLANAIGHDERSLEHGKAICDILHFFLCDERTPFRQKESLDDGKGSPRDIAEWYVGGMNIVKRNVERIHEGFLKCIELAKANEGRL